MPPTRAVRFTGIEFPNPFLLSCGPPPESESHIMRAYEAGWGGVVTKTIGLHPVINVVRAGAKFMRTSPEESRVSMKKRLGAALHSSWNRELLSDKPLDWWLPRIRRIKQVFAATGWSRSRRSGGPMPPTIAPATSRPRATLAPRLSGR